MNKFILFLKNFESQQIEVNFVLHRGLFGTLLVYEWFLHLLPQRRGHRSALSGR